MVGYTPLGPKADTPLQEQTSAQEQTCPQSRHPPHSGPDTPHTVNERRYASYWNAILVSFVIPHESLNSEFSNFIMCMCVCVCVYVCMCVYSWIYIRSFIIYATDNFNQYVYTFISQTGTSKLNLFSNRCSSSPARESLRHHNIDWRYYVEDE